MEGLRPETPSEEPPQERLIAGGREYTYAEFAQLSDDEIEEITKIIRAQLGEHGVLQEGSLNYTDAGKNAQVFKDFGVRRKRSQHGGGL